MFAELLNVPFVSVLTEIHYIQKGRKVTVNETAPANNQQGFIDLGPRDFDERLHYIGAAIMAKLRLETAVLSPYVALGPSFEYLLAHQSSRVVDQFNKAELAIVLVGGVETAIRSLPRLTAEIRYSPSVTDAYKTDVLRVRNQVVQFLVGIAI